MALPIYTPSLGMAGLWRLKSPFSESINLAERLTCTAVTQIRQLQESGIDVLSDVYRANSLTQDQYDQDVQLGTPLATLDNGKDTQVIVPIWAILGLPELGGVDYDTFSIVIKLAAMPADTSLDAVVADLTASVTAKLGVICQAGVMVSGRPTTLTESQHKAATARRAAKKTDSGSLLVENAKLTAERAELLRQIKTLTDYIAANKQ
jgi:hypothetical protein